MDPVVRCCQVARRGAAVVAVICAWVFLRFRRLTRSREGISFGPLTHRDRERAANLRFIYRSSDRRCLEVIRMSREPFFQLCRLFRDRALLRDSWHTAIEEQVAMFLLIVGHNQRFRVLPPIFRRSLETISRYFHEVMFAVGELRNEMIRAPSLGVHPKIARSRRWNPFFKVVVHWH